MDFDEEEWDQISNNPIIFQTKKRYGIFGN